MVVEVVEVVELVEVLDGGAGGAGGAMNNIHLLIFNNPIKLCIIIAPPSLSST